MAWETIIGLEVHIQLKSKTKLFSEASTAYGAEPNTQLRLLDIGLPGMLPVLNQAVIGMAIRLGLSLDATIDQQCFFSRKHYWYPDLPKGYQITQHSRPIIKDGQLTIRLPNNTKKIIRIERAHLEEDAGKLLHDGQHGSRIDFNRAGTPLIEIVTKPDFRSAEEVVAYLKTLHCLVRYLAICDGNMQEGSFRCDVNVSVRPVGQETFGTRTETKNLNSFRFIDRAIHYEVERQIALCEQGQPVLQETRLFDPATGQTRPLREKGNIEDYCYFPDPDLLPLAIQDHQIEAERQNLIELPWIREQRFIDQYQLSQTDAHTLIVQRAVADYFEHAVTKASKASAKAIANWVIGNLFSNLNKAHLSIEYSPISPEQLATLVDRIHEGTLSGKTAKTVFEAMWEGEGDVDAIIKAKDLKQISDEGTLETIIDELLANAQTQVEEYHAGKKKVLAYFIGQIMKATKGKANPAHVNRLLLEKLG